MADVAAAMEESAEANTTEIVGNEDGRRNIPVLVGRGSPLQEDTKPEAVPTHDHEV